MPRAATAAWSRNLGATYHEKKRNALSHHDTPRGIAVHLSINKMMRDLSKRRSILEYKIFKEQSKFCTQSSVRDTYISRTHAGTSSLPLFFVIPKKQIAFLYIAWLDARSCYTACGLHHAIYDGDHRPTFLPQKKIFL